MNRLIAFVFAASACTLSTGYEINNHADMSERALLLSTLNTTGAGSKLEKLGLKSLPLTDAKQTFPLDTSLLPVPYCFGSDRPAKWKVTIPVGDSNFPAMQQDGTQTQPNWSNAKLTLAQMIRYGACFEDSDEPNKRPVSHFYNTQNGGAALTLALFVPAGPSSLHWTLQRNF
ncbi:MAG: hypothetical protein ABL985_01000 [Casimicrobium sp.]